MPIELKDFVAETLTQIIEGVKEAQEKAVEHGAMVNPNNVAIQPSSGRMEYAEGGWGSHKRYPAIIEFDVAVTASQTDRVKGGVGVFATFFGASVQGETEEADSHVSRIKFTVPVFFPEQTKN